MTVSAHYDAIAAWYDAQIRDGGLIHDLGAIPGVAGVVLLMQDEESEV